MAELPHYAQETGGKKNRRTRERQLPDTKDRVPSFGFPLFVKKDPLESIVGSAEATAQSLHAEEERQATQPSLEQQRRKAEQLALGESIRGEIQSQGNKYDQMFLELIESTREERLQEAKITAIGYVDLLGEDILSPTKRFYLRGKDSAIKKAQEKYIASVHPLPIVEGETSQGSFELKYIVEEKKDEPDVVIPTIYSDEIVGLTYESGMIQTVSIYFTPGKEDLLAEKAPKISDFVATYSPNREDFSPTRMTLSLGRSDAPPHIYLTNYPQENSEEIIISLTDSPEEGELAIHQETFKELFCEGFDLVPHERNEQ